MAPIRMVLRSKIHRATVTQADLDYVGSISIDENLMEAAGIVEWEKIVVLDVTNGSRLETYAIKAPPGSGEICINGAASSSRRTRRFGNFTYFPRYRRRSN